MSAAGKLEVVAEAAQRDGGYAVIRLKGVEAVPAGTTFRIEPVDDDATATTPEGWPAGALTPIEVRPADGGSDLVIGPDIVDNPRLRPGTPVAIVIEALGLRQELLWPSLTPSTSPRRPARVLTMTQSAAMTQALRDAERRQAVVAQITKSPPAVAADAPAAELPQVTSPAAAAIVAATLATTVAPDVRTAPLSSAGLSTLTTARDRPPPNDPPLLQPVRLQKVETEPARTPPPASSETAVVPAESGGAPAVSGAYPVAVRDGDGYLTDYVARRRSSLSLVFGTLALVAASAAAGFAYRSSLSTPASTITTASVAGQHERLVVPASTLYDIFKSNDTPDAAAKLKSIDREQALSLADTLIHSAGAQRDLKQAEALLRHGLGLSLGDKSTLWALTQLGSLAAQPGTGEPDYGRARLLWELAAAQGDPVAMCFLGELHELGLGVPTNRPAARSWYLQAKQAGSCRTADAALARLK